MNYTTVKNLRWANAGQTAIDCLVNFEEHGESPFTATLADTTPHGCEIYTRAVAGDFGEIAPYVPPPEPSVAELTAQVLAKARALRPPIMSILDGMQASATATGATIMVNAVAQPLDLVIEDCKQALKDLPTTVDLSQCTTRQQMEQVVLAAYYAIVLAAPPEIKSAFDSLKP